MNQQSLFKKLEQNHYRSEEQNSIRAIIIEQNSELEIDNKL
jgi:hypothetical protein